jgi:hypothetical protein
MDAVVFDGLIFRAGKIEEICDLIMDGQESSRLSLGLELFHGPLQSSPRLIRVIRSVVQPFVLAVFELQPHIAARFAIQSQPVRDHDAWRSRLSWKLAHEALGGFPAALTFDANIENEAVRVDGAPQPMFLAGDGDDDFVQTPLLASPWSAATNVDNKLPAEFRGSMAHDFVGCLNFRHHEHFLDQSRAEGKLKIEPDSLGDDRRGDDVWRETVAAIKGGGVRHRGLSTVPIPQAAITADGYGHGAHTDARRLIGLIIATTSTVSPDSLPHLPLTWFPALSP